MLVAVNIYVDYPNCKSTWCRIGRYLYLSRSALFLIVLSDMTDLTDSIDCFACFAFSSFASLIVTNEIFYAFERFKNKLILL